MPESKQEQAARIRRRLKTFRNILAVYDEEEAAIQQRRTWVYEKCQELREELDAIESHD